MDSKVLTSNQFENYITHKGTWSQIMHQNTNSVFMKKRTKEFIIKKIRCWISEFSYEMLCRNVS